MEILGPCFPCSAGNAATVVLLRVEKWPGHTEPFKGSLFSRSSSQCRGWDVGPDTPRAEPRESFDVRKSLRNCCDWWEGQKGFQGALWGHCKVLQQGNPLRWGTNPQRWLLSAPEAAFCPFVDQTFPCARRLTHRVFHHCQDLVSGHVVVSARKPQHLHFFEKHILVFCRHFCCYSLVLP